MTSAGSSATPSFMLMPTSMVLSKCSSTAASSAESAVSSVAIFLANFVTICPAAVGTTPVDVRT